MCAKRDRKPGFDSEFDGLTLKIKLRGEIDHHSASALRVSMDDMIRGNPPKRLIIDMSAVDFMDSSGLGLIMGRYSLMERIGGETCVLDPSPATERIMSLAGMERVISIIHSGAKEDAIKSRQATREIKRRAACHKRAADGALMSKNESRATNNLKKGETK